MRTLVIDDLRIFPEIPEAVYARTLEEGFVQLHSGQPWDEVYLDHDLGAEETIRPLVLAVEEAAYLEHPYLVKQFYVCSDNAPGVKWIIAALEKYYPIMFRQPMFRVNWDETPA